MLGGREQLAPWFRRIDKRITAGELRVTDPEAVARYVMSVNNAPRLITGTRLDELYDVVRREIAAYCLGGYS